MSAPAAELASVDAAPESMQPRAVAPSLPTFRLNLMRIAYLVMGVGIAFLKWPLFFQEGGVAAMPVFEGVVAALLTGMGLLALLGLRYPVALLPILVLESLWKLIWMGAVGVPHLVAGGMTTEMSTVFSSILVGVIVIAVTPWDYVWKRYVTAPGDPWR